MGNKIVTVKPPVQEPPSIWKLPSLSTVFSLLTLGCVGYAIVQILFNGCIRCCNTNQSLECLRRTAKSNGRHILNEKKKRCAKEIERLMKAKDYFPENSAEGVKLRSELRSWQNYESKLNDLYIKFAIQDCSIPANGFPKIHEPRKSFLDTTIIEYLLQSSMEMVFWENTTAWQRDILNFLIRKLKTDYPHMSDGRLRSAIAHACNKEKRGVIIANQINRIAKLVKNALSENNAGLYDDEDEEICTICLSEITVNRAVTECLHSFHKECISIWFNLDSTCPICRTVTRIIISTSKRELRPTNRR